LSALGNVISALTSNPDGHIPYRDSKLTRILQDALGGNSRTAIIVCASSSGQQISETMSTLRFGARAKKITNVAHINTEVSVAELTKALELANATIERQGKTIDEFKSGRGLEDGPALSAKEASKYAQETSLLKNRAIAAEKEMDRLEEEALKTLALNLNLTLTTTVTLIIILTLILALTPRSSPRMRHFSRRERLPSMTSRHRWSK